MAAKVSIDEARERFARLAVRDAPAYSYEDTYRLLMQDRSFSQGKRASRALPASHLLEILIQEIEDQNVASFEDLRGVGQEAYCRLETLCELAENKNKPIAKVKNAARQTWIFSAGLMGNDAPLDRLLKDNPSGVVGKGWVQNIDLQGAFSDRVKSRRTIGATPTGAARKPGPSKP